MIETGSWRRRTRATRLTYGLLALTAIVLLVLDRPGTRPGIFNALRSSSDDLAAPVMTGVSAPLSGLRSLGETLEKHWDVYRQNETLRAELEEMEGWRELALSLRDKVSAYEAILGIPGVEAADPVGAWTVAESGGPFQHARLMAAGADKGINAGYPVLTDRGLVGRVVSVSERSSRVLLLTDVNSRVPVMTEDGRLRAILAGDNSGAPKLEFVSGQRRLERGDRIVTSGDAGVFPRGLPVGTAAASGDDVWRVALYSSRVPIDVVWVYPYDPITAPAAAPETPIFPIAPGEEGYEEPEAAPAEDSGEDNAGDSAAAPGPAATQEQAQAETEDADEDRVPPPPAVILDPNDPAAAEAAAADAPPVTPDTVRAASVPAQEAAQ